MDGLKLNRYITVVDLIIVSYLVDTLVLSFFIKEPGARHPAMMVRVLLLTALGVLFYHDNRFSGRGSHLLHFFYPVLFPLWFYGETTLFHSVFFSHTFDGVLQSWDQYLFGYQPAEVFSRRHSSLWFSELMSFAYLSYYVVFAGLFIGAYFKRRYEDRMEIVFYLIQGFIIYYWLFILFPAMGPQYLRGGPPAHPGFFGGLLTRVQALGERPTGAFPSSHVGMMLVFTYISYIHFKKVWPMVGLLTLLIIPATVYIQAHYAVDVVAGVLSAPLLIVLSHRLYRWSEKILWEEI